MKQEVEHVFVNLCLTSFFCLKHVFERFCDVCCLDVGLFLDVGLGGPDVSVRVLALLRCRDAQVPHYSNYAGSSNTHNQTSRVMARYRRTKRMRCYARHPIPTVSNIVAWSSNNFVFCFFR